MNKHILFYLIKTLVLAVVGIAVFSILEFEMRGAVSALAIVVPVVAAVSIILAIFPLLSRLLDKICKEGVSK